MSVKIAVSGAAARAVERIMPQLVNDLVASRITGGDASLWGPEAQSEAEKRLGWVEAVSVGRPLIEDIYALRDKFRATGVTHFVLGGMGGSSLAPEVITRTYGVELTVLDSTDPAQVRSALDDRLTSTAVIISSKSGSTLETDSQKRIYEKYFRDAGIDPRERIVIVTDPASPLDVAARAAGYRVFNADPSVGGRYSALTAFGLVPSGLAGVDLGELLDEAEAVMVELAVDDANNPGLILGAAIAGTDPLKDKLGIVTDGTHILGFGDWAEQLIAESTGKHGTGILPVVLTPDSPEIAEGLPDMQIVRLVGEWDDTKEVIDGEIEIAGSLGAQLLLWEYATVVAGRILGINPFDQPDVEAAKVAARALIDNPVAAQAPAFTVADIEVRGPQELVGDNTDIR
ncbi:MAG: glucose-6-phosphate isomerase, partial [Rhodoglobus sp.]